MSVSPSLLIKVVGPTVKENWDSSDPERLLYGTVGLESLDGQFNCPLKLKNIEDVKEKEKGINEGTQDPGVRQRTFCKEI